MCRGRLDKREAERRGMLGVFEGRERAHFEQEIVCSYPMERCGWKRKVSCLPKKEKVQNQLFSTNGFGAKGCENFNDKLM